MNIVDKAKNKKKYRESITENQLFALFNVMNSVGLADSVHIYNIPFCKDGKIAFIDTEMHHLWPIAFHLLTPSLSLKMQECWKKLTSEYSLRNYLFLVRIFLAKAKISRPFLLFCKKFSKK